MDSGDEVPIGARLMGASFIAKELGMSQTTFRRLLDAGEFPAADFIIKGERRWTDETLNAWKAKRT